MYKKFFLALFLLASTLSISAREDAFPGLNVDRLLEDYFNYRHIFDSINAANRFVLDSHSYNLSIIPADDIHMSIWTRERLNPYQMSVTCFPDSIKIDCSEFVLPVPGRVTSRFGVRRGRFHFGTDLALRVGDPVRAAFSGKVRIIDFDRRGFGHYVVIRHDNGFETLYAHLSRVLVEHDQFVTAGDTIALGGNSGRSTGPHLHFEIRYLGNAINPENIIDFSTGTLRNDYYVMTRAGTFAYRREVAALQAAQYVTVRSGDTLGHIARRHGTTVQRLCQLNGITPRTIIRPGQRLRVR